MKPWAERQWRVARWVAAVWFPVILTVDLVDRVWWLAVMNVLIGAAFIAISTSGLRGARALERLRRGGDAR